MDKTLNHIKGMIVCLALGDANGVPHEFKLVNPRQQPQQDLRKYKDFEVIFQFVRKIKKSGTISDDTLMTLALFKSLTNYPGDRLTLNDFINNRGSGELNNCGSNNCDSNNYDYNRSRTILNYMAFANTSSDLGRNTRKLFHGIKTINGYEKRYAKLTTEEKSSMQSNGSLMRISPIVLINNSTDRFAAVKQDTYLTNPNKINLFVNYIYVEILNNMLCDILNGVNIHVVKQNIIHMLYEIKNCKNEVFPKIPTIVKNVIVDIIETYELNNASHCDNINYDINQMDVHEKKYLIKYCDKSVKGWVCTTLYFAVSAFILFDNWLDAIMWIITKPNADTDTNGAVAGALFGMWLGYDKLIENETIAHNIDYIVSKFDQS